VKTAVIRSTLITEQTGNSKVEQIRHRKSAFEICSGYDEVLLVYDNSIDKNRNCINEFDLRAKTMPSLIEDAEQVLGGESTGL